MIVTRFAPSPTGYLHLGHAFAAITAHDTAKRVGGQFLVRIEDIDQTRCRPEFERAIFEDLAWLGLAWQEPVLRQSERLSKYSDAVDRLWSQGLIYPCFCTRAEIAAEIARASGAPYGPERPHYPGLCRALSGSEQSARMEAGEAFALRLHVEKATEVVGSLTFEEHGHGPHGEHGTISVDPKLLGDVVIARKDVLTSYHLAVVVDDADQCVTMVTRGFDLYHATHAQRLLQALLGLPKPSYAHHRLILDSSGKKLSKRDDAVSLRSLREGGASLESVRARLGLSLR